jgi:hypothetical protein
MGRGLTLHKLLDIAEVEARVREGEASKGFFAINGQKVTIVVTEMNLDAKGAQGLQIAIEPANVDPELTKDLMSGERALAEKSQETKEPGGALAGESNRKSLHHFPPHVASIQSVERPSILAHHQAAFAAAIPWLAVSHWA